MKKKRVTLNAYLEEKTIKACELAEKLGKTPGYISKLRRFKIVPPVEIVFRIKQITKNRVPPKLLFAQKEIQDLFK